MGRLAKAFESVLVTNLTERIGRELVRFQSGSACAGITGDSELQYKARINHYGGTVRKTKAVQRQFSHLESVAVGVIPERHFIDEAIPKDTQSMQSFEDEVAKILSGGKGRTYNTDSGGMAYTSGQATFAGERRGAYRVLRKIANEMANNQIQALLLVQPPNAESTVKRKGFNSPLVETGALCYGIRHWVEGI